MKKGKFKNHTEVLFFKRWSRKSFAIVRSIGKVVHIAVLAQHICQRLDEKIIASSGELPWRDSIFEEEEDDSPPTSCETLILLFTALFCCTAFGKAVLEGETGSCIDQPAFFFLYFLFFSLKCSSIHFFSSRCTNNFLNTFYQPKIIVNEN